ncbi:arginine-tRNA-protein transferase 1 [Sphaerulina musiva SO2202]|uniref:arginyltransferase n=1 Tax=Sphaerulina musiva (strain SO2202) TaxID=692275 RepID=N1QJA4_SPHMS|nr:arginine-tRNA-protein transferase 1 [Sphaerulina musiva SO2202]EMF17316.1 arginine-tRNA-protein transferase 1 [Sphaerulina musiva SO2202]
MQTDAATSSSSTSASALPSLLTPIGYQVGDCGYCKSTSSGASYYASTRSLSPEHYQELIDRGWRRSGSLLYLPDASRSCCVHYTIRLPVSEFKPAKDQRQALNRWNRFVLGDDYIKSLSTKYPKSKAEKKRVNSEFDLLQSVHESEGNRLKPDIQPEHRFEVRLEPDDFSEEKFELYSGYQRHVHHDHDVSKSGFKRFLCASPLSQRVDTDGKQLGSFHQCYRLDGRLIAMAVLDLLPHAVSGVYFVYHKDVEKFSFGKLSALREAALALEQNYGYYYMGYFIHSCRKMSYKNDYKPQFVLDLHSLEWQPLNDQLRTLMESRKYASLSKEKARQTTLDQEKEDKIVRPVPKDAMLSGLSILQLGLPGSLPVDQLQQQIDMDGMKVRIAAGVYEAQDLVSWESGHILDAKTLKGAFAELAACTGPLVAKEAIVDFSRVG